MDESVPSPEAGSELPSTVVVTAVSPALSALSGPVAFTRIDSGEPARIVLRQTDSTHFELVEGFRYSGAAGSWVVTPADLPETDLASIPQFLSWFVSRYGNHTLAALLHDHLVHSGMRLEPPVSRPAADDVFLQALTELEVPYLRSRLMWSAVTLATRWRSSAGARVALGVWMLAAAAGIVALVWGLVTVDPTLVALAVLAPIPAALLWGWRQRGAGLLGGYMLWMLALPAALNIAVYTAYSMAERVIRRVRLLVRPATKKGQVAHPPPYSAR